MWAGLTGFVASGLFSVAYALYDRSITTSWGRIVSVLAIPSFPGLVVGMMASGNAHVGGRSLSFILLVATVFNTLVYGTIAYMFLRSVEKS